MTRTEGERKANFTYTKTFLSNQYNEKYLQANIVENHRREIRNEQTYIINFVQSRLKVTGLAAGAKTKISRLHVCRNRDIKSERAIRKSIARPLALVINNRPENP